MPRTMPRTMPGATRVTMRVTILGAGTLLPDDDHRSPAHLVEAGAVRLLLDCGSGTLHGMARHGVAWQELTHVAISHFHTDHTGDLAALVWALRHGVEGGRERTLTLLGPKGLRDRVEALARAHGPYMLDPGFPLEIVELEPEGRWRAAADGGPTGVDILTHPTPHTPESIAYRIGAEDVSVGYTGDTGPHPPLGAFFEGVDLLIAECAMTDENAFEGHLSPASVSALLRDARPGVGVLTHLYPGLERRTLPDLIRSHGFTGRVLVGRDGLRLSLPFDGHSPDLQGRPGADPDRTEPTKE